MDSAALLRLISESTRHGLLKALRGGERTVGELVAALGDEQSNVSHHLATLRREGLVSARRAGRKQVYRLADAEVGRMLDQVDALATRLDHVAYTAALGIPTDPAFHGYG
ncbi:MAG: metalloregulator ArsR/SmtB family transcription factor [bacterium]